MKPGNSQCRVRKATTRLARLQGQKECKEPSSSSYSARLSREEDHERCPGSMQTHGSWSGASLDGLVHSTSMVHACVSLFEQREGTGWLRVKTSSGKKDSSARDRIFQGLTCVNILVLKIVTSMIAYKGKKSKPLQICSLLDVL